MDSRRAAVTTLDAEIVSDPKLHGGEPVIAGTGLRVRTIVEKWKLGMPLEEIPEAHPHISLAQVFAALYYYERNKAQIDDYMLRNRIPEEWSGKRLDPTAGQVAER